MNHIQITQVACSRFCFERVAFVNPTTPCHATSPLLPSRSRGWHCETRRGTPATCLLSPKGCWPELACGCWNSQVWCWSRWILAKRTLETVACKKPFGSKFCDMCDVWCALSVSTIACTTNSIDCWVSTWIPWTQRMLNMVWRTWSRIWPGGIW